MGASEETAEDESDALEDKLELAIEVELIVTLDVVLACASVNGTTTIMVATIKDIEK
ncbi:MAG: hypothetical protein FJ352_02825 [Firmicutes bacterium]|nr:hypothetical protein [Bacillota bacterium]